LVDTAAGRPEAAVLVLFLVLVPTLVPAFVLVFVKGLPSSRSCSGRPPGLDRDPLPIIATPPPSLLPPLLPLPLLLLPPLLFPLPAPLFGAEDIEIGAGSTGRDGEDACLFDTVVPCLAGLLPTSRCCCCGVPVTASSSSKRGFFCDVLSNPKNDGSDEVLFLVVVVVAVVVVVVVVVAPLEPPLGAVTLSVDGEEDGFFAPSSCKFKLRACLLAPLPAECIGAVKVVVVLPVVWLVVLVAALVSSAFTPWPNAAEGVGVANGWNESIIIVVAVVGVVVVVAGVAADERAATWRLLLVNAARPKLDSRVSPKPCSSSSFRT